MIESGQLEQDGVIDIATQMAAGIAAAHAAGIIHRDIKPANVMVTSDGLVKILDFGLAKVDEVQITQEGVSLGTVAYMSPEQARGDPVDARTDIWSFGAVLYELLSGRRPFKGDYAQAVLYTILHEDPQPLSDLNPNVSTELAGIVSKCLKKDAAERYASMGEVVSELRPQPVAAALPSKRVGRTVAVSLASVVATLLLLLALTPIRNEVMSYLGFTSIPREKHIAVLALSQDSETEEQAAFTGGLVETLVSSLQQIESTEKDLWVVPTDRLLAFDVKTAEEAHRSLGVNLVLLLDARREADATSVTMDLVDAADGRSIRASTISVSNNELSRLRDDLVTKLADVLDVELTTPAHRTLLAGATTAPGAYEFYNQGLGYLQKYREGNNLEASIILFKRAVLQDSAFALAYAGLCEAYWRKYEDAEDTQWVQEAETNCERALELNGQLASAYVTLGRLHTGTGRYGTAIAEYQLALARDSTNASALGGLAQAYESLGKLEQAEAAYKRAIALKPDYWGGYRDLGVFYFNQARYEDAIEQFQYVADLNPFNASAYRDMGAMYFYLDKRQDAIDMFNLALEIKPDHAIYSNLATLYYYEGRYADAAKAYEAALGLGETSYDVWGYLATAYEWSGKKEEAKRAHRQAIQLAKERLEVNPRDPEVLGHLASYYAHLGERDSALATVKTLLAQSPTDPQDLSRIGETYEMLGEREQAIKWLEKALENGYARAEIVDYPGFKDLLADPDFQAVLKRYESTNDQ
jgi:serine/threonine-protein kinase